MTEAEAKTRWCPIYGITVSVAAIASQQGAKVNPDINAHCIGSACMMWAWAPKREEHRNTSFPLDGKPVPPSGDGWELTGSNPQRTEMYVAATGERVEKFLAYWMRRVDDGYCGLAGRP